MERRVGYASGRPRAALKNVDNRVVMLLEAREDRLFWGEAESNSPQIQSWSVPRLCGPKTEGEFAVGSTHLFAEHDGCSRRFASQKSRETR